MKINFRLVKISIYKSAMHHPCLQCEKKLNQTNPDQILPLITD